MFWQQEVETLGRDELNALQIERLRASVERAAQSPFYQHRLAKAGVSAADIKSLDDLRRIPFTTKQDLRDSYPRGMLAVPQEQVVRLHGSSGTTGQSTVIFHTKRDLDTWTDLVARGLVMAGGGPADVFQNMMSYGLFTGGLGLHYGAERIGMLVIPAGSGNTRRQIALMKDFGTTIAHITPSYALHVSSALAVQDTDARGLKLRVGIFGAEPYSEETRQKLERLLHVDAYNCYGLSEMNGPAVAFECGRKNGLHVWEDSFIVEVIDPDTAEPVEEGAEGELVFTTINREAMPILRYRTRDRSAIVTGDCACGRRHRRIRSILGRTDDMLIIGGVNVFPSQVEAVLMRLPEVGTNYQIVLDRVGELDKATVRVELSSKSFHGDIKELRAISGRVTHELRDELVISPVVELLEPGTLEPSMGKAVRVIDNRQQR
ncbi:MAG: phenylacetate--CoA ligase [Verrucomicrobia bacterium]|nr:phenylacetate--CoA ligase [Verrucomicrobiota bacterium]